MFGKKGRRRNAIGVHPPDLTDARGSDAGDVMPGPIGTGKQMTWNERNFGASVAQ